MASRVVERYHRPAFVLGIENGVAQGSGRSIPAFHLLEALESMPELFTKFGGHRQAADRGNAAPRQRAGHEEPVVGVHEAEFEEQQLGHQIAVELTPLGRAELAAAVIERCTGRAATDSAGERIEG